MSFKVKAIYEYSSPHEDDLQFPIGQVITVTEEDEDDWYTGEYLDDSGAKHEGIFPRNFVEKYEPVAPPRPTRTKSKKEPEPAPEVPAAAPEEPAPIAAPPVEADEPEEPKPTSLPPPPVAEPVAVASPPAPKAAQPVLPSSPPRAPAEPVAPQSPPKESPAKRGPPPVTDKPATSSFKDRLALFNKAAAPPVAPFKPSGLGSGGSSSFIKKPFVAPPPKGNTYVPTQRNAPIAPVYRREEDPEIKEREAENVENAQKAGLIPSESNEAEGDEPKPMSLKERMALLQRQQQEQASRHAEAAAKKEKPKRPATKPRMPSHEPAAETAEEDTPAPPPLERTNTGGTGGKRSLDESRPPRVPAQPRRKPSIDPEPRDGNEADMSGAGELTEDQEELTEREDSDEKTRRPSRVSTLGKPAVAEEQDDEEEEGEEGEDEEEDEEAQEFRRKEELRARMARLGGGMGMPGMFGMPMPGAAPTLPPKKKKGSSSEKQRTSEDSQSLPSPRAPPVPTMMALPGMGGPKKTEEEPVEEDEAPEAKDITPRSPPAGENLMAPTPTRC